MASNVTMGNDEFILYIRKQYPNCNKTTTELGREVGVWMRNNTDYDPDEKIIEPCLWVGSSNINEHLLPEDATQFTFDRDLLPQIYDELDRIAK